MSNIIHKRLQTLSEFVREAISNFEKDGGDASNYLSSIKAYVDFLDKPLEIGMFVPCGDDNNILDIKTCDINKYTQAGENIIFSGVNLRWCYPEFGDKEPFIGVTIKLLNKDDTQWCGGWENFIQTYLKGDRTIEALTKLKKFDIKRIC
jgi:hypothetical protein